MLIGLSGKAQSGKDTVYKMMVYAIHYWQYYAKMKEAGYVEFKHEYSVEHMEDMKNHLIDLHQGLCKHAFATHLKKCLLTLIPVQESPNFESIEFKNSEVPWLTIEGKHPTYRELLQKFGTAIRDEVCSDFWVQAALNKPMREDFIHVFTDVRFKTEAEAIKERGGIIVRINRDGAGAGNHVSETELDDYQFDVVINNNGNLQDLLEQVRVLLKNLCLI